ncbi:hypothetical protein VNO77_42334 [Canavalia gladiata]|uniref:Uncharacterized protein n=1 Tax=Canavalia gladiata TaxID=3824 RepID=A0AAN9K1F1_CANGL
METGNWKLETYQNDYYWINLTSLATNEHHHCRSQASTTSSLKAIQSVTTPKLHTNAITLLSHPCCEKHLTPLHRPKHSMIRSSSPIKPLPPISHVTMNSAKSMTFVTVTLYKRSASKVIHPIDI